MWFCWHSTISLTQVPIKAFMDFFTVISTLKNSWTIIGKHCFLTSSKSSILKPDQNLATYTVCDLFITFFRTKRKSYKQMITSALKNYCPEYFTCGDGSFDFPSGLVGWYKLTRPNTSPADALFQRMNPHVRV